MENQMNNHPADPNNSPPEVVFTSGGPVEEPQQVDNQQIEDRLESHRPSSAFGTFLYRFSIFLLISLLLVVMAFANQWGSSSKLTSSSTKLEKASQAVKPLTASLSNPDTPSQEYLNAPGLEYLNSPALENPVTEKLEDKVDPSLGLILKRLSIVESNVDTLQSDYTNLKSKQLEILQKVKKNEEDLQALGKIGSIKAGGEELKHKRFCAALTEGLKKLQESGIDISQIDIDWLGAKSNFRAGIWVDFSNPPIPDHLLRRLNKTPPADIYSPIHRAPTVSGIDPYGHALPSNYELPVYPQQFIGQPVYPQQFIEQPAYQQPVYQQPVDEAQPIEQSPCNGTCPPRNHRVPQQTPSNEGSGYRTHWNRTI